jgi:ubiquinone/menaquinone biosynthesis C-methylase UbiE
MYRNVAMTAVQLTLDTPELAKHYDAVSADRQFKAGRKLVERLGIGHGERALDIGAGTGLLAEYVSERVGPEGFVAGVDPLAYRIALANARAKPNLAFRVGTAEDLSAYPDASFDVVYLNAVFHWLPDQRRALAEIHRVLKPGGRVGITTGSKDHTNSLQRIRREVLSREPYNLFPDAQDGVAHRVNADELRRLLTEARFDVKAIDLEPNAASYPTQAAAIEFSQASSFGNFLSQLPAELRGRARAEIEAELERLRTPDGIRTEGARIFALARKPPAA